MAIQVQCINKQDRDNPWERIIHIGGTNADKTRWKTTQQRAIDGIESGEWSFYVGSGSNEVDVIVRTSQYGNKYLTTEADGESQNNLLSLPECP